MASGSLSDLAQQHQRRRLREETPALIEFLETEDGGGDYRVDSLAEFFSIDHQINDGWSVNAGIRFTNEEKEAHIASLVRNTSVFPVQNECNVTFGTCAFDFMDEETWDAWSGKLGVGFNISDEIIFQEFHI